MTNDNNSTPGNPTSARRPEAAAGTPEAVAAFVADAISRQREVDGVVQLLADMAAVGDHPIEAGPTSARDALGVS